MTLLCGWRPFGGRYSLVLVIIVGDSLPIWPLRCAFIHDVSSQVVAGAGLARLLLA